MSKFFFYVGCAQALFATATLAASGHAQVLEETYLTNNWRAISLEQAFADIQLQTNFYFTYNYELIRDIRISDKQKNVPLADLLKFIAARTDLKFLVKDEIIYVTSDGTTGEKNRKAKILIEVPSLTELRQVDTLHNVKVIYQVSSIAPDLDHLIQGVVRSEEGEPLIGATVRIKETGQGTITDLDGSFSLSVPEDSEVTLVISYIGFETLEFFTEGRSEVEIVMSATLTQLDEVVVIGYGTKEKAQVTGAVSNLNSEELNQYAGTSFEQQLAGKIAGLQINEFGAPGSDAQIVIRGVGTLTAGSNPLIVVDGFPLTEGSSLSSINPKDIASIDILKDAASAAIYGARAANGVILIKTKEGAKGTPKISIDAYTGFQQNDQRVKFVDAYDAAQFFTEARDWGYVSKNPETRKITDDRDTRLANGANRRELRLNYLDPYLQGTPGLTNTDWQDEVYRNAAIQNLQLSVSGGTDKTNYYVSGSYFKQEGVAIGSALDRYNLSIKMNTALTSRLEFGLSLNPSFSTRDYVDLNGSWNNDPLSTLNIMYPFFSPYDENGDYAISEQIATNIPEDGALGENVVALINNIKNQREDFRTFGHTFLKIDLLEGLSFKTTVGADYRSYFYDFYNPSFVGQYRTQAPKPASTNESSGTIVNYQLENLLTYNRIFGEQAIDVIAGYTFQKEEGSDRSISGSGIADDNLTNISGASSFNIDADRYVWSQISYFSRLQYALKDRYLLSAAIRRDGSSRFGDDTQWGVFPAFSAGWIMSREPFFPESALLSFTKLRASWGQSGNNQIGSFSSKALVTPSDYVYGTDLGPGFATTTSPNPNLSWETNTSLDIGLVLGFFNNRLSLSLDYYDSRTSDLLLNVPVPQQSGFSSYTTNIGEVKNTGFEVEMGGQGFKLGAVRWDFDLNFSTNSNEVLALAPGQEEIRAGTDGAWRTITGRPIAEMYGYQVTGVYRTQAEIDASPHLAGTLTGDYIVEDINRDGEINDADKIALGTYAPKFTYGWTNNLSLKNFGLSFSLVGIEGRKVFDWDIAFLQEVGEGFAVPSQYYFDNRYHPENNPDGFFAQPNLGNFSAARRNTRTSSIYFKDGDYLRLRNVQLSYTLPGTALQAWGLSQARIYLTANNLFTLTSFRGNNPDGTASDILQSGYMRGNNYPVARSFIAGLAVTF
ncbi:MAG: TonB-dependent receptor [Saprospiraceae bacterium]|nr:TonB-dependent receptor [Lewinella sp.]